MSKIPVLDLRPEIDALRTELMSAIEGVLDSTAFIMGPNVKAFEQEVAAYLGVKHAVALNSGTDALILGVHALGIKPGDEVITTAFTFFATGEAVSHFRATPVFVDIDPATYNMNVDQIEAKITPRTKAIIPVHLFGQPCDMDAIMAVAERHGLKVLEDVAQAFGGDYRGRKLGAIGHAGAFSFFPSKNLGAFGDGGMLVTNDDAIADHARMLRVHGAKKKYYNETVGVNSRLDELQAAILRVKFRHIDEANAGRRRVAHRYNERLFGSEGVSAPVEVDYGAHVFHQYTVRIKHDRDGVQKRLEEAGIGTMVYYPVPMHRLPVYKGLDYPDGSLPHTERAASEVLSLPIWPQMDEATQDRVIEALRQAVAEGAPVGA